MEYQSWKSSLLVKLITFLLCILSVEATYQWKCSQPEEDKNIRYLPGDIPSRVDQLINSSFLNSRTTTNLEPDVLFIYQVPRDVLTDCNGRVSAIEYCFNATSHSEKVHVFTFYNIITTKRMRKHDFQIKECIDIWSEPDSTNSAMLIPCNTSVHCGMYSLNESQRFSLKARNMQPTTFGVSFKNYSLLGFSDTVTVKGFQQNINISEKSMTISLQTNSRMDLPFLSLRLVINNTAGPGSQQVSSQQPLTQLPSEQPSEIHIAVGVILIIVVVLLLVVLGIITALVVLCCVVVRSKKKHNYRKNTWELKEDTSKIKTIGTDCPHRRVQFRDCTEYDDEAGQGVDISHEYAVIEEIQDDTKLPGTSDKEASSEGSSKKTVLYIVPAKDENSLYTQLDGMKITTLTRDSAKITDFLGSGQFGKVHKGVWQSGDHEVEVAVKTLKEGSSEIDKVKFLQEAAIMGQFSHPNVVKLHGVITTREPILIVLEFLSKGDLRNHLIGLKPQVGEDEHTLLSYCRQVASGMCYLANKAFVHRDLAARNILVAEDDVCKIADFGMSRDLEDETYYVSHGGKIPVKWTAPEALNYRKYSTASDVWSFGCVMYEIWSLGHKPFEDYSNQQTIRMLDKGYRLPPPTGCPVALYEIIIACWHPLMFERPSFNDLMQKLSMPDTRLLKWSDEDKAVHPEASKIGAELEHASELYTDLQSLYTQEPSQYEVPKAL